MARWRAQGPRPIPSGQVSVRQAVIFLVILCLIGLGVLLQFNGFTVLLGVSSLLIVAVYPFMKRITYWPQAVLGLAFNWGALVGWSAIHGSLSWPPILLYAGGIAWTLAYDTIYAHQDKEDDVLIGVKSTALKFGDRSLPWLAGFFFAALALIDAAIWQAGGSIIAHVGIAAAALHAAWQLARFDAGNPALCLELFRSNRIFGLIITLTLDSGHNSHMIDDLLSLAGDAVAHARKLGADAVHAIAADGRSTEIELREGHIEKLEQAEARDISLKVYCGKSSATISGSVLTSEAINRLADKAFAMARLAPPDPFAGIADPEQLVRDIPDLDLAGNDLPDTAGLEHLVRRAESIALAVPGVTKSGGAGASASDRAVAIVMSNGFAQGFRRTGMGVSVSAIAGERH